MNSIAWFGALLALIATSLTILHFVWRGLKSSVLKAFNFAETWKDLVISVRELKELAGEILGALRDGKETMKEHTQEIGTLKTDVTDLKQRVRSLEEV